MSLPSINIIFKEEGIKAIERGQKGIVALVLKEETEMDPFEVISVREIPEDLKDFNKKQIELALMGYNTPPRKVICYVMGPEELTYKEAQEYLETARFDYVAVPEIDQDEAMNFATWVKTERDVNNNKIKAVLPNCPADHEGVVNFTTSNIVDRAGDTYTASEYCSRIAGFLAGTRMQIASTFGPLPEVVSCERYTKEQLDDAIKKGQLVIFHDGEKVKIARGVNSYVTPVEGKLDSFKKIKLVEVMDLIYHDIKKTAEDHYLGKYANSYDNKMLLVVAILGYLEKLELDNILERGTSQVEIDLEKQRNYLKSKGRLKEDMRIVDIKKANTDDKVFLAANIQILDAIEEITLDIAI